MLASAQLEHVCRTAMKHAVSLSLSQKLFRKRSLNTVSLLTEFCKLMTIILLSGLPQKAYGNACTEWSTGFLETNYVHLVIKIEPDGTESCDPGMEYKTF